MGSGALAVGGIQGWGHWSVTCYYPPSDAREESEGGRCWRVKTAVFSTLKPDRVVLIGPLPICRTNDL